MRIAGRRALESSIKHAKGQALNLATSQMANFHRKLSGKRLLSPVEQRASLLLHA